MSRHFEVNTSIAPRPFAPQWRRIGLTLALAFLTVATLTPLAVSLGFDARRSSVTILRITALASLVLTAGSAGREESGLFRCDRPLRIWARGFVVGAATLMAWVAILVLIGERSFIGRPPLEALRLGLVRLGLAFLIGFAEDLLFFGFLYAALGRKSGVAAAIYALAHFISPARSQLLVADHQVGLRALLEMGRSLLDGLGQPIEVLGLFLVGWVLISLRRASGSLWLVMGVHGGWYWVREMSRKLSVDVETSSTWLFGTGRYYDGVLGWLAIMATGLILMRAMQRRELLRGEEEG